MFDIWKKNGLSPPAAVAPRKVGSCMRGEQEATTTRFKPWSSMLFLIRSWPGSEHMNLYSLATTTSSSFAAKATTSSTFTLPAMFVPQWQTKTPIRGRPFWLIAHLRSRACPRRA